MKKYKIIDLLAQEQLIRAFKSYGIEGTEQKIKELYSSMPKIRETLLTEYYKLIRKSIWKKKRK